MKPIPIDTTVKRAIIFGAGRIAEALTPILVCVGFCVWFFDNDPEAAQEDRFPQADNVLCGDFGCRGVISARGKVPETKARLRADGIWDAQLDRIHSPIGTPIRAVSPEEIAVSIAGEMILDRTIMREGEQEAHHKCPMKAAIS